MLRSINIANEKKRDASIGFETCKKQKNIFMVMKDKTAPVSAKILKTSMDFDLPVLVKQYGALQDVGRAIIESDPDVDIEKAGMHLRYTNKVYITKDNNVLYGVDLCELVYNPDGSEKEKRFFSKSHSNVNTEIPIKCTGKTMSKQEACKKFVFSYKYQLKHVNGLTYDFLYDIAKQLHETNALMFVGAGKNGNEPLIFYEGGTPYRGFLEGRVKDASYILILHLTNLELKELS